VVVLLLSLKGDRSWRCQQAWGCKKHPDGGPINVLAAVLPSVLDLGLSS
jgi:hypothetical protein